MVVRLLQDGGMNRLFVVLASLVAAFALSQSLSAGLRAGASAVDITPTRFPVIQNGGFIEGQIALATDKLYARCLALDDGNVALALVIVDSCMIPRTVCDEAKRLAAERCGLPSERVLIAATHTHSAPSVMDYCLGSRADPDYTAFLPGKIAEAIEQAMATLQKAKAGFGKVDAASFTNNRRWIIRAGKEMPDPFGEITVRAMMHPGYQNDDYVGPSGPIDPWFSFLSVQTADGKPLAWLGNFSMHYFSGHAGASSDYFGLVAREVSRRLAPDDSSFVAMHSQGTSGDLWWGDYSKPKDDRRIEDYARELTELALEAQPDVVHSDDLTLAMAERRLRLKRRLPSPERLEWARGVLAEMGDRRPRNQPEVYAEQAVYLHEHPTEECVLQAIRIGEIGITGIPNEVYALTGLELKARSPTDHTINLSLANGAAGYIPPPEQHHLGGYTTWPARTAGLAVDAEPTIVEEILDLLESVAGRERRSHEEPPSLVSKAVMESNPLAYWRLGEMNGPAARDASGHGHHAHYEMGIAFHLPGIEVADETSIEHGSRSIHVAGGRIVSPPLKLQSDTWSIECRIWNGVPVDARSVTGWISEYQGLQLGIAGQGDHAGKLMLRMLGEETPRAYGRSRIGLRQWHHVALVREEHRTRIFLDGTLDAEVREQIPPKRREGEKARLFIGGLRDAEAAGFEGKIDEFAFFDRSLSLDAINRHLSPARVSLENRAPESPPSSPEETLNSIQIARGFQVELVAAEPLVKDPVAIDWGYDGRLWVVEMADYPYGLDGRGAPGGRVRYLVDTDKDGTYDRSTLFLDGLSFPTSVMAWKHGVLIAAAPDILYAEDTDGDGKADKVGTLFSGFMEGNQQLRVNGLRWGLDNWIYAAGGGHHAGFGQGTKVRSLLTEEEIELGSRDMRFRPDVGWLEPRSGPSQFGRVRDDWGNWYGVQNSFPLWHYVLDDHYLGRNPHVPAIDTRHQLRLPSNPRVYPATPPQKRYHSREHSGRYTSACGPSIYRDELLFPNEDDVLHAFTCEPFHNLVQHHVLREEGVSFAGERGEVAEAFDFFASSDRWCRPVMTRTGPDGALWVVDMYRYMIEHPDWLPPEGQIELEPFYRSGDDRGRIYRVFPRGKRPRPIEDSSGRSPREWLGLLQSPNGHLRDLAQQRLVHARDRTTVSHLESLASESPSPRVRLQALATLEGLDALTEDVLAKSLNDPHPALRRHALVLCEPRADSSSTLRRAAIALLDDTDPKVRLQLACSLGEWRSEDAGRALYRLALESAGDPFLDAAIHSSVHRHFPTMATSLDNRATPLREPILSGILSTAPAHPELVPELLARVFEQPENRDLDPRHLRLLAHWLKVRRTHLDEVGGPKWIPDQARKLLENAHQATVDPSRTTEKRLVAIDVLGWLPEGWEVDTKHLASVLEPSTDMRLQHAAINALGRIGNRLSSQVWQERWKTLSPALRKAVVDQLLTRDDRVKWLLGALEKRSISGSDISPAHRQRLMNHADEVMAEKARAIFGGPSRLAPDEDEREKRSRVLRLQGLAPRGEPLFTERCAACHHLGQTDRLIGPDLRALTDSSPPALLSDIMDPNASIDPQYIAYTATLTSGEILYGIILTETGNSLIFRGLDGGEKAVLRSQISHLESTASSFMPDGLEEGLADQEIADLLAYVESLINSSNPESGQNK